MATCRVLVTDYAWPSLEPERAILSAVGGELVVAETDDGEEMRGLASTVDAILTCWRPIPVSMLEAAGRCRIVSRYGIGLDNIPVARATELGIVVTNVPDFCLDEVSDHVMGSLLALARRLPAYWAGTRRGLWSQAAGGPIRRLRGQTLGLLGYGGTARALVPRALGFGLEVLAYTPRLTRADVDPGCGVAADLEELLRRADYLSIHVPLSDETRGIIDEEALRAMKETAYLINTSRGGVLDEEALLRALREGWIAGAALDVLTREPPAPDHPLLALDNVLVTPHVAFYSEEAIADLQRRAARHVAMALAGEIPPHVVNPAVLEQDNLRLRAV